MIAAAPVRPLASRLARWWPLVAALVVCLAAGCTAAQVRRDVTFSYYHAPDFVWPGVARVVVLPLINETAHPQAADEMRRSLTAELQQLGCFEVVPAPVEATLALSRRVREAGSFPEGDIVHLARCTRADVIVTGTVGHYSPYYRPRIGLTLQVISPDLGRVVASADGLWDSNNLSVGDRARAFYARKKTALTHVHDTIVGTLDDAYANDVVLESPHLFQRFVCGEAARLLVGDPAFLAIFYPPPPRHATVGARLRGLFSGGCQDGSCAGAEEAPPPAQGGAGPGPAAQRPAEPASQPLPRPVTAAQAPGMGKLP